jgi:fermentation-respiration switch protein FrsA (DUF1100 family)
MPVADSTIPPLVPFLPHNPSSEAVWLAHLPFLVIDGRAETTVEEAAARARREAENFIVKRGRGARLDGRKGGMSRRLGKG